MKTIEKSLKELSRSVLNQARSEAKEIMADAQVEADAKQKRAQEQAATERSEILLHAQRDAQDIRSQAIAGAQLKAQKLRLERREKMLEAVFNKAQQKLATVPERKDYEQIIRHLIEEAVEILNAGAVRIHPDQPSLGEVIQRAIGVNI